MSSLIISNPSTSEKALSFDFSKVLEPSSHPKSSPIDEFYEAINSIILLGTASALQANKSLGRVLLLGLVSAAEYYFRSTLAQLIEICPRCYDIASKSTLSLGAVRYHGPKKLGYGVLENTSFSTSEEVRKATAKITGIQLSGGSLDTVLKAYDKVCHLRHASVHAQGYLGDHNMREIGVKLKGQHILKIELAELHALIDVTQNLVRAYNCALYRETLERWNATAVLAGLWSKDWRIFSSLFNIFYSERDKASPTTAEAAHLTIRTTLMKRATASSLTSPPVASSLTITSAVAAIGSASGP